MLRPALFPFASFLSACFLFSCVLVSKERLTNRRRRGARVQVSAHLEQTASRGPRDPAVLGVGAQELRAGSGDLGKVLPGHGRKERPAPRR